MRERCAAQACDLAPELGSWAERVFPGLLAPVSPIELLVARPGPTGPPGSCGAGGVGSAGAAQLSRPDMARQSAPAGLHDTAVLGEIAGNSDWTRQFVRCALAALLLWLSPCREGGL